MNLIEIGKNPEILKSEKAEQPKNLEIITENLTQPSQLPEESPIKLKVEKDLLMQSFERAKEFIRTQRRSSEINRRNSVSDNRIVRNAEAESIASAEQRRSEEQKICLNRTDL